MSNSQEIMQKIAALRNQLHTAQGLVQEVGLAGRALMEGPPSRGDAIFQLDQQVASGGQCNALLDGLTRQIAALGTQEQPLPRLTAQASRLLRQARDLLHQLRDLANDPLLEVQAHDPLPELYRETAAMIDATLRGVSALPQPPSVQKRLCEGLEAILDVVAQRVGLLHISLDQRRREDQRIEELATWLQELSQGEAVSASPLLALADSLWQEARQGVALRFLYRSPAQPAHYVACHGLTVAQVMARLLCHDAEWQNRGHEPVVAALVHDVGMIHVATDILTQTAPLSDEQRRLIESHTLLGADYLRQVLGQGLAVEAARSHHECMDGTGYPSGLREEQLHSGVRLLAVCDRYAALCCPRPYRASFDTRAALTETLQLTEKGALDRVQAQKLLRLSFYPVGAVVELSDGAIGVVVATERGPGDIPDPSRPVVTLLADSSGHPLPAPRQQDLADSAYGPIVRSLSPRERYHLLGKRFPLLV